MREQWQTEEALLDVFPFSVGQSLSRLVRSHQHL